MGMEYRPFYFAQEWIAAGHDVTIIGADFSHLRGRQPTVTADLEITTEGHVRFRWLRTRHYDGNGVRRVVNMLEFVGKLFVYGRRIAAQEKPDIVICSSTYPLDIYPGARIARRAGSLWSGAIREASSIAASTCSSTRTGSTYVSPP